MEVVSKRRGKNSRNGVVVAGCVWENRMRFDEFKGGINVYSEKEETPQVENDEMKTNEVEEHKKLEMGSKTNLGVGCFVMSGKRKTWKSESNFEGNPIEISTKRSQLCKELSVSAMKKSPIQSKKREGNEKMCELKKVKNVSPNGNLRNSLQLMKAKSEKCKEIDVIEENKVVGVLDESKKNLERVFSESSDENKVVDVLDESKKNLERVFGESSDGNEENKVADVCDESKRNLERVFVESSDKNEENKVVDVLDESKRNLDMVFVESSDGNEENKVVDNVDGDEGNQIQLRKVKSEANKAQNVDGKNCDLRKVKSMCLNGNLKNSLQMVKTKTEKCNKSFEKNKVLEENCEEKVIRSNVEPQEKLNLENEDFKILEEEIEKENSLAKVIKTKKIVIVEEKKVHISNNEKKQVSIPPIIKKQSNPSFSGQSRILHHHPSPTRTKPGKSIFLNASFLCFVSPFDVWYSYVARIL
ncbi:hypothetical protein KY285_029627 [Solanum tuberosum]|nr:hypothetical protein KY285_029627 [Solanum tuberosum]